MYALLRKFCETRLEGLGSARYVRFSGCLKSIPHKPICVLPVHSNAMLFEKLMKPYICTISLTVSSVFAKLMTRNVHMRNFLRSGEACRTHAQLLPSPVGVAMHMHGSLVFAIF